MSFPRFMYAASEEDADLLYATRFFVPDAFLWWRYRGKSSVILSALEVDRGRRQANVDRVYSFSDFLSSGIKPTAEHLIVAVCKKQDWSKIEVPPHFPAKIVELLRRAKIQVLVSDESFFPERRYKTSDEIRKIRQGVVLASIGLSRGIEVLKQSKIKKDRRLFWGGGLLTSERLRGEIDASIIRCGGLPAHTIVAGGKQACDPHERGSGPLKSGEAIILDIFPRDSKTGYFGDLTRTFVKGRATESLKHLYQTVKKGKAWVMEQVRPGVSGNEIHQKLVDRFKLAGFPTERRGGVGSDFFMALVMGLDCKFTKNLAFRRQISIWAK